MQSHLCSGQLWPLSMLVLWSSTGRISIGQEVVSFVRNSSQRMVERHGEGLKNPQRILNQALREPQGMLKEF